MSELRGDFFDRLERELRKAGEQAPRRLAVRRPTLRGGAGLAVAATALVLALVIPAFVLLGGRSEDAPSNARDRALLARVSAAITAPGAGAEAWDDVVYADFAEARRQLGLAPDADVYRTTRSGLPDSMLLESASDRALGYSGRPITGPLVDAIDPGAIQAAARTASFGPAAVVVIDSTQPFEDIAAALLERGYVRNGRLLATDSAPNRAVYPVVANGGAGTVILAGSEPAARAALEGLDARLTPAAALIRDIPGVARMAHAGRSDCLLAQGAGQELTSNEGEYLLVVDGPASAARVNLANETLPSTNGEVRLGAAEVESDRVWVKFRSSDPGNPAFAELVAGDVAASVGVRAPYRC